ncbi:MAG: 1,2-dihydroxy-3-keto-5-methylthiopentene dioxygenase [Thelocarpon superellum]|nr:MAG: 1,2-dihydroxy-3-keto-5-methylthiopentene dioxygenase [Thelocarpon superellum]
MKAYWYDNEPGDQRHPHDSGRVVSPDYLAQLGVLYSSHGAPPPPGSAAMPSAPPSIDELASSRGYVARDVITVSPAAMGDVYAEKIRMFFNEHLHEDEEIRYILAGRGFFDVRSPADEWYIQAMRLFKETPKWTPLNRAPELEDSAVRKEYLDLVGALARSECQSKTGSETGAGAADRVKERETRQHVLVS